jgi:lysophospholipase L1-like esterase
MLIRRTPILRIGSAVLLAAGVLAGAGCDRLRGGDDNPMGPSGPPTPGSTVAYAAIGASDVFGFGSSGLCFGIDGPSCMGYVAVAARQLRSQGYTVNVTNLGIPTATISARFQQLGQQYAGLILGNFIDNEVPLIPRNATVVSVFAGGNDVNAILAAVNGGAAGTSPDTYIDLQVTAFGDDFLTLLNAIRSQAPSARIVVLNLPNLGALPYLGSSALVRRQAQRVAVGMTTRVINPQAPAVAAVVDLMCEPRLYQPANLDADGFHPNDAGYAIMAEKLAAAIASSSFPAPAAACAQMTLIP